MRGFWIRSSPSDRCAGAVAYGVKGMCQKIFLLVPFSYYVLYVINNIQIFSHPNSTPPPNVIFLQILLYDIVINRYLLGDGGVKVKSGNWTRRRFLSGDTGVLSRLLSRKSRMFSKMNHSSQNIYTYCHEKFIGKI
jgi:hypothetical protein